MYTGVNLAEVDRDGGLNLRKWSYTYGSVLPPEMGLNLRKLSELALGLSLRKLVSVRT